MTQGPPPIISYAQNAEDIVLWRGLSHVPRGAYVDVGAAHPVADNVTQLFYERGWSGINIEPDPQHFALLEQQRRRDVNLNMGAAGGRGERIFFRFPQTGFSTFDEAQAEIWKREGLACKETRMPVGTLEEMIAIAGVGDIHFLKIDVEGYERQVLEGIDLRKRRPWIVVIEATAPRSNQLVAEKWEDVLFGAGYGRCLFDGINLFYCAEEHPDIAERISHPANVIDNYRSRAVVEFERQMQQKDRLIDSWRNAFVFAHHKELPARRAVQPPPSSHASPAMTASRAGTRKPSLFVDVTCLKRTELVTGIQRVTLNVAVCLKRLSGISGFDTVFCVFDGKGYCRVELELTNDVPSVARLGPPLEQIWLRQHDQWLSCELNSFDIVDHFDWYRRVKDAGVTFNFWVYDLFPIKRPDWSPPVEVLRFRAWWERIGALADRIICDSAEVARAVEKWMMLHPTPFARPGETPLISYLHLGADGMDNARLAVPDDFQFAPADPRVPREGVEATFMSVASLHPRKGLDTLVRAFELLWDRGREVDLVLTGMPSSAENLMIRLLRHPRRNRNLFYEGYIEDGEIRRLLGRCDALIVPSFDEGFGLPIVEAAFHGLPSIVRDIPVFREIAGDDVFYFDDAGPEALAAAVENWLSLPPHERRRIIPGTRISTWEDVTRRMLDLLDADVSMRA